MNYFKELENNYELSLIKWLPFIIRLDWKSFHTLTKWFEKPFDINFQQCMWDTMLWLCNEIEGVVFAYQQSDEISLLCVNKNDDNLNQFFNWRVQKIVSIASSIATYYFNTSMKNMYDHLYEEYRIENEKFLRHWFFDARVFSIPDKFVVDYFMWRQMDCTKNSIQSLAQSLYKHNELNWINIKQLQNKMLTEKNVNWNNLDIWKKRWVICKKNPVEFINPKDWKTFYRFKFELCKDYDELNHLNINDIINDYMSY